MKPELFQRQGNQLSMRGLKEKVLRDFGDKGAETLERYLAQIEYTAFWCIRMLRQNEHIEVVMPEVVEDVVIKRNGIYELHQVKTRDEKPGAWPFYDVLSILCQQYHRRNAFSSKCQFHFVSNQIAESKSQKPGSLYRLKYLLDIKHDGQIYQKDELDDLIKFEDNLKERIKSNLLDEFSEKIDDVTAIDLLHNTWIETNCPRFDEKSNILELNAALEEYFPGHKSYVVEQLKTIYDRIILLIIRKITKSLDLKSRSICIEDILECQENMVARDNHIHKILEKAPGFGILEKKLLLGGFSFTEIPYFVRQKHFAKRTKREYENLNLTEELEVFVMALLERQRECREKICRQQAISNCSGPYILSSVKQEFTSIISNYLPNPDINEVVCMGLLWDETEACIAWWHDFQDSA